jgi:hypothetical protein
MYCYSALRHITGNVSLCFRAVTVATEAFPDTNTHTHTYIYMLCTNASGSRAIERTGTQGAEGRRKSADLKRPTGFKLR